MAILVTGGAGYIGSHMTLDLLAAGRDVVVADNLSTGKRRLVDPRATFVEGNVGDAAFLDRLFDDHDITAIIHFAGSIIVPESVSDPLKYYGNNTAVSRVLIERAVAHGIRHFIFSSTAAVYGNPPSNPVTEQTPTAPLNPYGTSKLMTELMLRDTAAAHDFRFMALRYFNVAGADPEGRSGQAMDKATHLIKVACETALGRREKMAIFGTDYDTPDGTGVRDYIHVSDLVSAHRLALEDLEQGGDSAIFNCGYGKGASVRDVIDSVARAAGHSFTVDIEPRRAGDSAAIVADPSALRARVDWQPRFQDLDLITRHAFAWEKSLDG